jgi:hypothetical protein
MVAITLLGCSVACKTREPVSRSEVAAAPSGDPLFEVTIAGKHGFIDSAFLRFVSAAHIGTSGKLVINPQFDSVMVAWPAKHAFEEGLVAVCIGPCGRARNLPTGKWGYIDSNGELIIATQFDEATPFSEGLAAVCTGDCRNDGDSKWGYIDKSGKYVINPQFGHAYAFKEGLAVVCVGNSSSYPCDGKEGYIDHAGKFVINPQFDDANSFENGLALIAIGPLLDRKNGYINKTGRVVWEPSK